MYQCISTYRLYYIIVHTCCISWNQESGGKRMQQERLFLQMFDRMSVSICPETRSLLVISIWAVCHNSANQMQRCCFGSFQPFLMFKLYSNVFCQRSSFPHGHQWPPHGHPAVGFSTARTKRPWRICGNWTASLWRLRRPWPGRAW